LRAANFALAVFLAAYILSFVDRQILSLMVEPIKQDLGLSDLQIGLLQGLAFALLYALVGVPIGMLADRISRRTIIGVGIIFWSLCTALCGVVPGYAYLFLARMGVGVGEATLSPAAHSWMSDAFPPERLARAMAIYTLGITVGGGLALLVGGTVVDMIAAQGAVSVPLMGEVSAWRAVFLAVAAPGVLVAALLFLTREPPRGPVAAATASGLGATLRHLARYRGAFGGIYANSTLLAIMGYGLTAWYPTLLIRRFGLSAGEAALGLGLIYLFAGSAGTLTGGLIAQRLAQRGYADANLRVTMGVSLLCIVPASLAALMPTPALVLLLFLPLTFVFNGYFACSTAAIQLATPSRMRATNAALFLMVNSLIGLSVGTAIVPLIDSALFGGTGNLGPPLALVGLVCTSLAALVAWRSLTSYGRAVEAIRSL